MASIIWNKNAYGKKCGNKQREYERIRYCIICGKQAVKGKYCQSCAVFIRNMKKRDQMA